MNVYEANNITIPDGSVKRILDMNGVVLWKKIDYTEPFYVENIGNSVETVSIRKIGESAPDITIQTSTDKETWSTLGTTSTTSLTISLPVGGKVYLRANASTWGNSAYYNGITGCSKVGGNIMSLLYGSNFTGSEVSLPSGSIRTFYSLFGNNTNLVDAGGLLLPAITLVDYCYDFMFYGCTSLTTAPALPATTLASSCYMGMFYGCTSLTTAPALPATTLAGKCYASMFYNCTSLTTAPALPATTLATRCYDNMFWGCTSLTTAPELPATTLTDECYIGMFVNCKSLTKSPYLPATNIHSNSYQSMFNGCSNLSEIRCNATNGGTNSTTLYWVGGVAVNGTFYKNAGVRWIEGDTNDKGVPSGWTIVDL